jgi:hypothetical protein
LVQARARQVRSDDLATACKRQRYVGHESIRKLIVSIHSTANDIVTGPPSDQTNFMVWAQAGIEDSLESFLKSLANVDSILLDAPPTKTW